MGKQIHQCTHTTFPGKPLGPGGPAGPVAPCFKKIKCMCICNSQLVLSQEQDVPSEIGVHVRQGVVQAQNKKWWFCETLCSVKKHEAIQNG